MCKYITRPGGGNGTTRENRSSPSQIHGGGKPRINRIKKKKRGRRWPTQYELSAMTAKIIIK